MQNVTSQHGPGGNAILGIAGALGGAALGGAVYYGIMAASDYQIGYIACLVGVASGYGSLLLGKTPSAANGLFCAVFSLGAILGAEYLYYQRLTTTVMNQPIEGLEESFTVEAYHEPPVRKDYDDDEGYAEALAAHNEFMSLSPQEQQEFVEKEKREVRGLIAENFSFGDYLTASTYNLIILMLFGFFGISYGYKIGVGQALRGSQHQ